MQPLYAGIIFTLILFVTPARALTNNLALTPPMGWNSWNHFQCDGLSDAVIRGVADTMATNGMKAAGYVFVNMDDCWQISRDTNGVIVADPVKFPRGIKSLADYVHSQGLKLGIYSDHGVATCQERPGGFGYEYLDANTYASWGVDYLKYDNCNLPANDIPLNDYLRMSDALMKCGYPITFSLCYWGFASWEPNLGNLWRTTGDISDNYSSMVSKIDQNSASAYVAGLGRWNDPDMLEVGNGGMSTTEDQTHFTMWCIMAAPLIAGNDITSMTPQTLEILTNGEAIAVDQDPAGEAGVKVVNNVSSFSTNEVWSKTLGYDFGTKAVVLFNRTGEATNITCNWTNLGLQAGPATMRDLWSHANLGTFTNGFTTNVPSHAAVFLKVVGIPPVSPVMGTNYLSDLQSVYAYVGWGTMTKDLSIGGHAITLGDTTYTKGLGVHAFSGVEYNLGGVATRFKSVIGVDAEEAGQPTSIDFQVFADGTLLYDSGVMYADTPPKTIDLDVHGVSRLVLGVNDAYDGISCDHADWANALVTVSNTTPVTPYPPTGLTATSRNTIALSWNASVSGTGYLIRRSTDGGRSYTIVGVTPVTSFSDSNVMPGTNYNYVVFATNRFGPSGNSAGVSVTACATPAMPTNVVGGGSVSNVVITWNPVSGAISYNVSRAISSTAFTVIASGLIGTNYTDMQTPAGQVYYYTVTAANDCSQGLSSAFVSVNVPIPALVPVARPCIGIHFSGTSGSSISTMAYADAAGVVPQTNWNNVNLSGASSGGLGQVMGPNSGVISDNSGQRTTVTMSYSAQGMWSVDQAACAGNHQLLDGYADVRTSGNGYCFLGNIPYSLYDVYVYVASDNNGRVTGVDINGGPQTYLATDTAGYQYANPLIQAVATSSGAATGAHYVLFPGVTGSSLKVDLNWLGQNVGLAAIQITPSMIYLTNSWNGTNLNLNWPTTDNARLMQSSNLSGPWTTNSIVQPPVQITPTTPQMFYQIKY